MDRSDFWSRFPVAYGAELYVADKDSNQYKQIVEIPELGVKLNYPPSDDDEWCYKNSQFYRKQNQGWVKFEVNGTYDAVVHKVFQVSF